MYECNRFLVLAFSAVVFAITSAPAEAVLVKYAYAGNPFTDISVPILNSTTYSVQNIPLNYPVTNLSFWFSVDDSLVPRNGYANLVNDTSSPNFDPSVIQSLNSYYFSDGYLSLTNNNGIRQIATVSFDTDANGNINGNWNVFIGSHLIISMGSYNYVSSSGGHLVEDFSSSSRHPFVFDPITSTYSTSAPGKVFVDNNPGTWTRSLVTVPLPEGMLLFGSALYGLYLYRCLAHHADWVRPPLRG